MKHKDILSKIVIAKKLNKRIIRIKLQRGQERCLILLWKNGYIYGYKKDVNNHCFIFLKINQKDEQLFQNCFFLNKTIKRNNLYRLTLKEKNSLYLLIAGSEVRTNKDSVLNGIGGKLFFQL